MKSKKLSIQNKIVLTVLCLFIIQDQFYAQIPLKIQLYGMIDHIELTQAFGIKQFNTENLSTGIYIISVISENKTIGQSKIIKE